MRASDEAGNVADPSHPVSIQLADDLPPGRVTDLAAVFLTATKATLRWTAPGGDGGSGRAARYDLRFSESEITEQTWGSAARAEGLAPPDEPGTIQTHVVAGLLPSQSYHFALKTLDERPNESALSNIAQGTTFALGLTRLTTSTGGLGASFPDWSPDGRSVLFSADWAGVGTRELYLVTVEDGTWRRLTESEFSDFGRWSPDGDEILCRMGVPDGAATKTELATISPTSGSVLRVLLSPGGQKLGRSAWSPSGERVAFSFAAAGFPSTVQELRVLAATGGDVTVLRATGDAIGSMDWSPDGHRIALSADGTGDTGIWLVDVATGENTRLTTGLGGDTSPRWSPDGSQILFSSDRAGNFDLWLMGADGSNPRALTSEPVIEASGTWSPDGSRVAFVKYQGSTADIWVLDLE
ncbi:MAG: PD40 domain-containing protein [Candidatus Eisenbacteria bacterium]|nr:PD40 domain-containing protein [Candidatus Eisenbacteria bacterium]